MNNEIIDYASGLGASEEIITWCKTVLAAASKKMPISLIEAEHIVDFLLSSEAPTRLRRMSFAQAKAGAEAWTKASLKRGRDLVEKDCDTELVMDLEDGNRIVKLLTDTAFKREGFMMRHCSGSMSPDKATIYSLRDKNNDPHVTFEITTDGKSVQQIKGKGNGSIHPRYIESTLAFLKHIGLKIRPGDMVNLGYYHTPANIKKMLKRFVLTSGKGPEFVEIGGNEYIFQGN